jgi:phosphoribosyl-AMP cyclohydrolase / phosphoribosyl-ATP pyrophosphohydrolase
MPWTDEIAFDERGLVPVVAQDAASGEVLMLAWANREALGLTRETGRAHYWSRSRGALWIKGETSGNVQEVVEVRADCDADAVLYRVRQTGPACHTRERSCFHRAPSADGEALVGAPAAEGRHVLARIEEVVARRDAERPEGSYTTYLFAQGADKTLKKIGEEAAETIVAAKNADPAALASESADLLFHLLVLWRQQGLAAERVWAELERRFGATPRPEPRASRSSDPA